MTFNSSTITRDLTNVMFRTLVKTRSQVIESKIHKKGEKQNLSKCMAAVDKMNGVSTCVKLSKALAMYLLMGTKKPNVKRRGPKGLQAALKKYESKGEGIKKTTKKECYILL